MGENQAKSTMKSTVHIIEALPEAVRYSSIGSSSSPPMVLAAAAAAGAAGAGLAGAGAAAVVDSVRGRFREGCAGDASSTGALRSAAAAAAPAAEAEACGVGACDPNDSDSDMVDGEAGVGTAAAADPVDGAGTGAPDGDAGVTDREGDAAAAAPDGEGGCCVAVALVPAPDSPAAEADRLAAACAMCSGSLLDGSA
jgi:hypothetical protein